MPAFEGIVMLPKVESLLVPLSSTTMCEGIIWNVNRARSPDAHSIVNELTLQVGYSRTKRPD